MNNVLAIELTAIGYGGPRYRQVQVLNTAGCRGASVAHYSDRIDHKGATAALRDFINSSTAVAPSDWPEMPLVDVSTAISLLQAAGHDAEREFAIAIEAEEAAYYASGLSNAE